MNITAAASWPYVDNKTAAIKKENVVSGQRRKEENITCNGNNNKSNYNNNK